MRLKCFEGGSLFAQYDSWSAEERAKGNGYALEGYEMKESSLRVMYKNDVLETEVIPFSRPAPLHSGRSEFEQFGHEKPGRTYCA